MICEPCTVLEKHRAPVNGQDVEMEVKGYLRIPSDGLQIIVITLWQCPFCKAVELESETE